MTSNTHNTQYPQSSLQVFPHNPTQYTSQTILLKFLTKSLIKIQLHIIQYQCQIYPTSMYVTLNVINASHQSHINIYLQITPYQCRNTSHANIRNTRYYYYEPMYGGSRGRGYVCLCEWRA